MSYYADQIVHAVCYNKPISLANVAYTPFHTMHYEHTDILENKRPKTWTGPDEETAIRLLSEGKIRVGDVPSSHYPCCGQWKTNYHMWWCENTPRYNPMDFRELKTVDTSSPMKDRLRVLEQVVLIRKDLMKNGIKWDIPNHLKWLMEG